MKNLFYSLVLSGVLLSAPDTGMTMVTAGVWYDEQEMAVAIDLNHPEWQLFNRIEMDFNSDLEWGQIIDGSEWMIVDGVVSRRFEFGIFRNFSYPDGRKVRYFGWSHNPLFENERQSNWSVFIDKLYYGETSPESLQCYTHEWVPTEGKKVVFCQTIDAVGNTVPVLPSDIDHIFVRQENSEWTALSEFAAPTPPMILDMHITPATLPSNSKGQYITARISLPQDINLKEDLINMTLHFEVQNQADKSIEETHLQPAKWSSFEKTVKKGVRQLIFKLPRQELGALPQGKATITFTGQTDSAIALIAEGTISIR